MSVYWDTSAILTLSAAVYAKLREGGRQFTLSHLTELELTSAVARVPVRRGTTRRKLERAVRAIHRSLEKMSLPKVLEPLFASARRLAAAHRLGGGDSLHLAAALLVQERIEETVEFASFDRILRAAAADRDLVLFPRGT
ncbi:MAG: type II toxin-antitoxin system VapC family toxin [Planctomycetes bacterium]|nr:type II toxin-antitoxin system VapC family toxin [Planctomycetota bacterium]